MPRPAKNPTAAPKTKGIKIRIDAFLAVDNSSYAAKRDAYDLMDKISSGQIPDDLFSKIAVQKVTAKEGSAEVSGDEGGDAE